MLVIESILKDPYHGFVSLLRDFMGNSNVVEFDVGGGVGRRFVKGAGGGGWCMCT